MLLSDLEAQLRNLYFYRKGEGFSGHKPLTGVSGSCRRLVKAGKKMVPETFDFNPFKPIDPNFMPPLEDGLPALVSS